MNLENDWEELENYEDEVKGEMRVRGKQLKNIAFDIDVGSDFFSNHLDLWFIGDRKTKIKLELTEEEVIPQVENPELILSEMTKLFGEKGAQEILAMETEMQLNFEKIKDSTYAKLWPCLPLNMKFDF